MLLEGRLQRLERILGARHYARGTAGIVAVAVGVPDDVLVGAAGLPGNLVAAANLLHADQLGRTQVSTAVAWTGVMQASAVTRAVVQEELVGHLVQVRRARRLDRYRLRTGRAVRIQVLVEPRLQLLTLSLHDALPICGTAGIVAVAVGVPDDVLVGAAGLPGNLVAAANLLHAD